MRRFARGAVALLAAVEILLGGRAIAAPTHNLAAAAAAGSSLIGKTGYRQRAGRYDCAKIRHYDGSFDMHCRPRERLIRKYLCDPHANGPNWRMHCRAIWVKPEGWRHGRH